MNVLAELVFSSFEIIFKIDIEIMTWSQDFNKSMYHCKRRRKVQKSRGGGPLLIGLGCLFMLLFSFLYL